MNKWGRTTAGLIGSLLLVTGLVTAIAPVAFAAPPSPVYTATQADAVSGDNSNNFPDANGGSNGIVDSYTQEILERPWDQDQDDFYSDLDIVKYELGEDSEWLYFKITTFAAASNNGPFAGWEIGRDGDPRGGLFIRADQPQQKNGSTYGSEGRSAYHDGNNDVGAETTNKPDAPPGSSQGFEDKVFDQSGGDVQVRATGNVVEFAARKSFIYNYIGPAGFTHRAWMMKGGINDPSAFYNHDKYTRDEAGSPFPYLQQAAGSCPNGNEPSASGQAALDSGTSTNTGNSNPCYPTGNVYEIDNGPWLRPAGPPPEINIIKDGPNQAQRGDTITYEMAVSIPDDVPLTNVQVTDPKCNVAPTLVSKTGGDQDDVLEKDEVWNYTCPHLITANDPNPLPNTATATGTGPNGEQVRDDDDHLVTIIEAGTPAINIRKTGPREASVGDTITYTLRVSLASDIPLHDVIVTDPRCDQAPTLESKAGGDQDAILEVGELWTYKCPHKITKNDPDPLPNTATVEGTDDNGTTVEDEDDHLVDIVPEPQIRIKKTGPRNGTVGQVITYTLEVWTPVNRDLYDVEVTDNKCDNKPQLKKKTGGDQDNVLEKGEVWVYTCTHRITDQDADNSPIRNVATVTGEDERGVKVNDKDDHLVEVVLGEPPIVCVGCPLPFTGSDVDGVLFTGLGLMLSGAGVLWFRRRKGLNG